MLRIIGLTGVARCGKDTVAAYMRDHYGATVIQIAAPLRRVIIDAFGPLLGSDPLVLDDARKDQPLPLLSAQDDTGARVTPRDLMQFIGTELFRGSAFRARFPHIGSDLWARRMGAQIDDLYARAQHSRKYIIVSDVRFENEAREIISRGGCIWHITRPGAIEQLAATHSAHESEQLARDPSRYDIRAFRIDNSGSIADLHARIDAMIAEQDAKK